MKFIALASFAAYASAIATTSRNCNDDPEILHEGSCRSLWYKSCDQFLIEPKATCNFETFSDAQISWFSDSIDVYVWNYVMKMPETLENGSPDSSKWSLRQTPERSCQPESLGSSIYKSEQRLQARNGNCGFKFQLKNNSEIGQYDFKFLRNSAEYLAAGVALTVASSALF